MINDSSRDQSEQRDLVLQRRVVAVAEACGDFIEYWGFKSIHGRVWAYLAISSKPLSQTQVARALKVSRALVNIAINELSDYGLVRRISEQRHAPYEAVFDVWPVIANVLREREWMLLETTRLALEAAITEIERSESPLTEEEEMLSSRFNVGRLEMLLQMTEWAQGILKLLINARLPRATDRWGAWMTKAIRLSHSLKGMMGMDED